MGAAGLLPVGFDAWFARCVNRNIDARFPRRRRVRAGFRDLASPARPRASSSVASPTAVTGHSFSAGMPAWLSSAPPRRKKGATGLATNARVGGLQVGSAADTVLGNQATVGVTTGQPLVSTDPSAAAPGARFPKILLAVPVLIGAVVAAFFVLRGKPDAGSGSGAASAAGTGTGTGAAPAGSASGSAAPRVPRRRRARAPRTVAIPGGGMFMGARYFVKFSRTQSPRTACRYRRSASTRPRSRQALTRTASTRASASARSIT